MNIEEQTETNQNNDKDNCKGVKELPKKNKVFPNEKSNFFLYNRAKS